MRYRAFKTCNARLEYTTLVSIVDLQRQPRIQKNLHTVCIHDMAVTGCRQIV